MKDIPEPLCWICNNYQEVLFTFTNGKSCELDLTIKNVQLNLDIDQFVGDQMVSNRITLEL